MARSDWVIGVIGGTGIILFLLFAIRMYSFVAKYLSLVQNRYPEKAKEYGFLNDFWWTVGGDFYFRLLFKADDIPDPEIEMCRVGARRSIFAAMACLVGMWIVGLLVSLVSALICEVQRGDSKAVQAIRHHSEIAAASDPGEERG